MKKGLDSEIMLELLHLAIEKKIDFKKWFEDESMMLESVPVSIYELMTVLPRDLGKIEDDVCSHYMTSTDDNCWIAGYMYMAEEKSPELVDALGKLLIWCIQEGWLG